MRLSIILILTQLFVFDKPIFEAADFECSRIEAKAELKHPEPGRENGEISIEVSKATGRVHYFFFNHKGYPLNSGNELQSRILNLKSGLYKCTVVDESGCLKQLELKLN